MGGGSLHGTCHCGEVIQISDRLKVSTTYQQINLEAIGSLSVCERLVNVVKLSVAASLHSDLLMQAGVNLSYSTAATHNLHPQLVLSHGYDLWPRYNKLVKACETSKSAQLTRIVADHHSLALRAATSPGNVNKSAFFFSPESINYRFFTALPHIRGACSAL